MNMDALEFEKAKQLRKIAESKETDEPVADFKVKLFPDGHFTSSAMGSPIEIATMIIKGMLDIERQCPEARVVFNKVLSAYLEGIL